MSLRTAILPLHALAHETRWRIIELLLHRKMSVGQLVQVMQLPQSSVSEHLGVMRRAGVVNAKREGKVVCYHISDRFTEIVTRLRTQLRISESTDPKLGRDAWCASDLAD
jgi:DNA-binding transcriptional ArsR family regulator